MECDSTVDVKQVTKTPEQQQLRGAPEFVVVHLVSDENDAAQSVQPEFLSKLATRQPKQSQQYSKTKNDLMWCNRLQRTASREQCDSSWN